MNRFIKVVLLFFVTVAAIIFFLIWQERRDYTGRALEIDSSVTEILDKRGVKDTDVIQQFRREKKSGEMKWLEITREIDIKKANISGDFASMKAELLKGVRKRGIIVVEKKGEKGAVTLEFAAGGNVLLRLILHPQTQIKVALVMDDLGYDNKRIYDYLALDIPITFSVLPKEKYTKELVKILREHKALYLMHQPMEPEHMELKQNYPGKAALLLKMPDEENRRMLDENLKWVPGAYGTSNHMGSEFTQHYDRMKYLMGVLNEKGLAFFDSSTSNRAVGKKAADSAGVPASYNNIFLDIEDDAEKIHKQLLTLLVVARKHGRAAAICHITKKHLLENLKEMIPVFRQNGVEFVDLKEYIESQ
jgi:polysaccharide deacetylase 2 family uncharacterized protein YibQ